MNHETTRLRALLFDCDGVLVDTTPLHREAFLQALAREGIAELDYTQIAGRSTLDALTWLNGQLQKNWSPAKCAELRDAKQRIFAELADQAGPEVYPDHSELFTHLSGRFALAVVSSASRASVDRALKKCGIAGAIKLSLSADDVARAKPDPALYREACRRLGVEPGDALVIEDASSGVQAGVQAGCQVIGYRTAIGPRGRIERLSDLLDLPGASA